MLNKKRVLKIFGICFILFLFFLSLLISLPIFFKEDILNKVKEIANNNVNAKIDFKDVELSLFKSFPDFTLTLSDLSVAGIDEFKGTSLATIKSFELTIDLISAISGDTIEINSFGLTQPKIHARVLKNGKVNWDIAKPSETTKASSPKSEEKPASDGGFHIALQNYFIKEAHLIFEDTSSNVFAELVQFNHSGRGDFTQDLFVLATQTSVKEITCSSQGTKYLNKANVDIKIDLAMDLAKKKFTFKENEFKLNELFLGFNGFVQIRNDSIELDLSFDTKKTEFKNILSMIPSIYAKDFESIQTKGKLALNGKAKGILKGKELPAFSLHFMVENAMFKYPSLPKAIENINIAVLVENSGGVLDNTLLDVSKFHLELAQNPIDLQLKLKTPLSDPDIQCRANIELDLRKLKEVLPLTQQEEVNGFIKSDLFLKGKLSSIQKKEYENFEVKGLLKLRDTNYKSQAIPYDMALKSATLEFSPQFVMLSDFHSVLGKSDLRAEGKLENFLAFALKGECLKGNLSLTSQLLDLNEFVTSSSKKENEATVVSTTLEPSKQKSNATEKKEESKIIEVPKNIDFVLRTNLAKVIHQNIDLTNVVGLLSIREQTVKLQELKANAFKGEMIIKGSYSTKNIEEPMVDLNLELQKVDVLTTFKSSEMFRKMAPVAESAIGQFSSTLAFQGLLDSQMKPRMNSLQGKGQLKTHNVTIESSSVMGLVGDVLQKEEYKSLNLVDVDIAFSFKEGKISVQPFDISFGKYGTATISGFHSFDQALDYKMVIKIPLSAMGDSANKKLNEAIAQANKLGLELKGMEHIPVDVTIKGTSEQPKVSANLEKAMKEMVKKLENQLTGAITNKAKEEAEKLLKDKLKKEAEDKLKKLKEKNPFGF